MAGLFSLGGGGGGRGGRGLNIQQGNNNNNEISPESWFRNNNSADQVDIHDTPYKGFELWQPHDYRESAHHPHQQQQQLKDFYLSDATGEARNERSLGVNIVVSDQSRSAGFLMMRSRESNSGGGDISCQDCGNQAKKECTHMRCRTCCKSRGFHCQTHVKSTWVPAAKRRERLQQLAALHQHRRLPLDEDQDVLHYQTLQLQRSDRENNVMPKKLKDNHPTANYPNGSSGSGLAIFPSEVTSTAVFRSVRVSSIDNADSQYAYQTSVNIGGHLFKGILYDQGLKSSHYHELSVRDQGSCNGGSAASADIQQLNLITNTASSSAAAAASSRATGGGAPCSQVTAFLDPSLYHSASLNSFMAGTQFFTPGLKILENEYSRFHL